MIFEELEPRLLFSADGAEVLAADVFEQVNEEQPVVIVVDDASAQQGAVAAEKAADQAVNQPTEPSGSEEIPDDDAITAPDTFEASAENTDPEAEQTSADISNTFATGSADNAGENELTAIDEAASPSELIFINDNINEYETLIADIDQFDGADRSTGLVILDSTQEGLNQVTEILKNYHDLDALHFVTYGSEAKIGIGNDWLDSESLRIYSDDISSWGEALNDTGDILFYGCNIAADSAGEAMLGNFADLCGVDVAASDDVTGHAARGGDWDLEYRLGDVESEVIVTEAAQYSWSGVLDIPSGNLWFSTAEDVPDPSGVAGLPSWSSATVLELGDTNSTVVNFDSMVADGNAAIASLHYVSQDVLVGPGVNEFQLLQGDVLVSFKVTETVAGTMYNPDNLLMFRPTTPGDFSAGTWTRLLENPIGQWLGSVALVEQDTLIGDYTVTAGNFLMTTTSGNDIRYVEVTGTGSGTTAAVSSVLIQGSDIGIDNNGGTAGIDALELIQIDMEVGGTPLTAGQLLFGVVDENSAVGSTVGSEIAVNVHDIGILNVTQTELGGTGISKATAAILLDGTTIGLDTVAERNTALALWMSQPNTIVLSGSTVAENVANGTSVGIVAVHDNLVTGGDFLGSGTPATYTTYTSGQTFSDWTVTAGGVDLLGDNYERSPGGGNGVDLGGGVLSPGVGYTGTISQTLATVAGQEYEVSFELSGAWFSNLTTKDVRVGFGGTSQDIAIDMPVGWSSTDLKWSSQTLTFTATSASTDLTFESLDVAGAGAIIGDIAVVGPSAAGYSYALTDDAGGRFAINATTGEVTVADGTLLDYETATSHDITVRASLGASVIGEPSFTIQVTDANDAPVISSLSGTYPYSENAGAVVLGGSATVTDVDSTNFDGGQLVYQITNNGLAEDRLDIRHQGTAPGEIGVSVLDITYGGMVIGSYTGGTTGNSPLVVTFNSDATVAAVEATLKNVTYENTSETPTASTRTLQVYVSDGDGGTSNTLTGSVAVTPVNDAPILDNTGTMNLPNVLEDTTDPNGELVSAIIASAGGDRITDVDAGALEGLAIIAVDNANGSWEYSSNGGVSWTGFGAVSNSSAVVLSATVNDRIRFVPDTGYTGNATITFRAWDTSDGHASGTTAVDTGTGGGSTSFSTATETGNISVEGAAIKLILSTTGDVGPAYNEMTSQVPGMPSWSDGSIIAMREANISFGENDTAGTFTFLSNIDAFAADSNFQLTGLHYVTNAMTINGTAAVGGGAGAVDLLAGDILFTSGAAETLTSTAAIPPAGWTNSSATAVGNIYAFRPIAPEDYSDGFFKLVLNQPGTAPTIAFTMAEASTTVGDTVINKGDFLFVEDGDEQKNDIVWYQTAAGTTAKLIEGDDIGIEGGVSGKSITGLELVETGANVRGVALGTGTLLVTLDQADTVGNNNTIVTENDIFALDVSSTTLAAGTAAANAVIFFDGDGNVKFDTANENLDALSLIVTGTGSNQAPILANSGTPVNFTEDGAPTLIDPTITVVDADSSDFAGGLMQVSIVSGGAEGDRLSIFHQGTGAGELGVSGNDVTYGGTIIGTFNGGLNSADPLVVNLNANADATSTRSLMQNITFWNTSGNPAAAARTIEFFLNDGDGGTSNTISQTATVTATADAPLAVDDHFGLDFDGIDDLVSIADSASLTMTGELTMEAWINADPSANINQMIINKEGEYEVGLFPDGTLNWAFTNSDPGWTWHNTGYVVAAGEWTHIAVSYDNGAVSTYVNGALVDTYSGSGVIADAHATLDELRIGGRSNDPDGKYFDGRIDEVRIWNTVRSQAEIQASMDQNLLGNETGLAGYWSFSEGSGTSVADLTGNGNTGTLIDGGAGTAGPQWTGYSTDQDTQLSISAVNGVVSNDSDADGDALTVTQVNGNVANVGSLILLASGANLTVYGDGSLDYDPNGAFDYLDASQTTTDSFTYLVDDGTGGTDMATVTITIAGLADAPVINNLAGDILNYTEGDGAVLLEQGGDAVVTDVDSTNFPGGYLNVEVDSGLQETEDVLSIRDQGITSGLIGINGSDVTYSGTVIGSYSGGTGLAPLQVTFNADATAIAVTALIRNITYENTNLLNPNLTQRSVTIDLTDGNGGASQTQNLTINITAVNDGPVFDLDADNSSGGATGNHIASFTEGDAPVAVIDSDVTITDADDLYMSGVGMIGEFNGSVDGSEEIYSMGGEDFVIGTPRIVTVTQGNTDFELDFSDGASFQFTVSSGTGEIADFEALLSTMTYQHIGEAPTAGVRTFAFLVVDANGGSSNLVVSSINVTAVNDDPLISSNTGLTLPEASSATITQALLEVTDPDNAPAEITYTITTGVAHGTVRNNGIALGVGSTFTQADINAGRLSYQDNDIETTSDSFSFTISDGAGGSIGTTSFTITVTPVNNNDPVATDDSISVNEGATATSLDGGATSVLANDTDTDLPNDALTVALDTGVNYGTLTLNADGTFSYAHDGSENFSDSFIYTVSDADGGATSTGTVSITVNPVNDNDPVATDDTITVDEGATATTLDGGAASVLANDSDTDLPNDSLTVAVDTNVAYGTLTLNADGTFSYAHDGSENFSDSFTYIVSDADGGATSTGTVTININPVNDGDPVATDDTITVDEGATATTLDGGAASVLANDLDADLPGDTLTATLATDVAYGTLTLNADGTFSYAHDGSENFTDSFTYIVSDADGGATSTGTVSIVINPVNDNDPVAIDDSITVDEGATVTTLDGGAASVLANDSDTDLPNDSLTVAVDTNVAYGTLTLNADGTFSYAHDGSENFSDSFTYIVSDADGGATSTGTVTININPVNDGDPVATDDTLTVDEGATATTLDGGAASVLANDLDADLPGDTLTATLATDVAYGTLTLNADGTFSYAHDGSENFTDSFTYIVSDADGGATSTGTVTIAINPVNDNDPVAIDDSITVDEGATVTTLDGGASSVLANDSDTDLPNDSLTVAVDTDVAYGSLTLNADGTFSYAHDGSENFSDSFTYIVSDADGGATSTGTVTININPVNDGDPVATDDTITVDEGATATTLDGGAASVLANDLDADLPGDTLTATLATDVAYGTLTLNADGTFSYAHDGSENFSDSFTYTVSDADGGVTSTGTVSIVINPVNDNDPVAVDDSITVNEGAVATTLNGGATSVLANDSDTDLPNDSLTVAVDTDVAYGTLTLNADGTFSYVHDGSENFSDSFTYIVSDADGGTTSTGTVSITVNPVNDNDPVATDDSISVNEGATGTSLDGGATSVLANDTDVDLPNDSLSITLDTDVTYGTLTLNADGTFSYTHDGSENFSDSFAYIVSDANNGTTSTGTVTIAINPVNDNDPVAVNDSITVDEGATATILDGGAASVLANDSDTDLPNDSLTVALGTGVNYGTLTLNADGTFSYAHDGSENLSDSFTYIVSDADGGVTSTGTVTISINPVNDGDPVATDDTITVNEGATATTLDGGAASVLANDLDADLPGDTLTATLATDVAHGSLTLNPDGAFSYAHDGSENFTDSFTYIVSDADGGITSTGTVSITINPVNDNDPVAIDDSITVNEGAVATTLDGGATSVLDNDTDTDLPNDSLTVALGTGPANGTLTLNTDGTFSYAHDGSENFTDSFTYIVSDADGGVTSTGTVSIVINPINDNNPVAADDSITVDEGATATTLDGGATSVLANDTDTDLPNDSLTVAVDTDAAYGTLTLNADGTFSYAHDGSENFTDSFTYIVSDADGGVTSTGTVTISINPVNDGDPVATDDTITVNEGATATTLDGGAASVLANDLDADLPGDTLTATLATDVAHGSLTLNPDGTFSYAHDGSENFTDSFTYIVSDADGGVTSTGTVSIVINPANDNDPVAIDDSITVNEGAVATTLDGGATSVLANDSDTDLPNDSLTVAVGIGPGHGILILNTDGSFSYTHDGSENFSDAFTYIVSDADGGITDTGIVSITVNPINDNAPVIGSGQNFTVSELASVGDSIGIVAATDMDTGTTLSGWAISGGNSDTIFEIDPSTGELRVLDTSNLDFDTTSSYTLNLTVSDGLNTSITESITINITDVSLAITAGQSFNVSETATNGISVGSVATTGDTPVTFTITGGNIGSAFTIDNSGLITVANSSAIDYEMLAVYSLTVEASDGTTPVSQMVVIDVLDDNESPVGPVTDSDAALDSVAENAAIGDYAGFTALATDADGTDTVTYSLAVNPGNLFAIDPNSGLVSVNAGLDYESATSHAITVLATSSDSSTSSRVVTISVTDVNEFGVSSLTDSDGSADTVAENSPGGTAVGVSALATDGDGSDSVTYSLSDDAGGRFAIDSATGIVTVAGGLDYETATSHTVTVVATSSDSSTSSRLITISISDLNETVPVYPDPDPIPEPDPDPEPDFDPDPDPIPGPDDDDGGSTATGDDPVVNDPDPEAEPDPDPLDDIGSDDPADNPVTEFDDNPLDEDPVIEPEPEAYQAIHVIDNPDVVDRLVEKLSQAEDTADSAGQYLGYLAAETNGETPATHEKSGEIKKQVIKHHYVNYHLQAIKATLTELSDFIISPSSAAPFYMGPVNLDAIVENEVVRETLKEMQDDMDESYGQSAAYQKTVVYAVSGVSASFAAGFVSYLLRAGSLMSSFLATVPVWSDFDPVAVLVSPKKKEKKQKETDNTPPSELTAEQKAESMFASGRE